MSFAIVVPYRAGDTFDRAENAQAVLESLAGLDVQLILAEHSPIPDSELKVSNQVVRVHRQSDQPFNKAAACNLGFQVAAAEVLAFFDADMVISPSALLNCMKRVAAHDEVIRPFGFLTELSQVETLAFRENATLPEITGSGPDDSRGLESIPACGGAFVIRAIRYRAAGGMDERFIGWGGEDNAFESALRRVGSTLKVLAQEPAFHLWHPRSSKTRYLHPNYESNLELAKWWDSGSDVEIAKRIEQAAADLKKQ